MTNRESLNIDAEDFHIFYDATTDSLAVNFYGMRRSTNSPVSRDLDALRDPVTKELLGIELTGFIRRILPELLQIGVIEPTIGHIHVGPPANQLLGEEKAA